MTPVPEFSETSRLSGSIASHRARLASLKRAVIIFCKKTYAGPLGLVLSHLSPGQPFPFPSRSEGFRPSGAHVEVADDVNASSVVPGNRPSCQRLVTRRSSEPSRAIALLRVER